MKLSIIIVNYNVKYYLEQCLTSLERALAGIEGEVTVVDNHSSDGSLAYLKPRFPHVTFIESNHNLGFARANNIAIRQSRGEYVLMLNPDTIVGEQTLKEVMAFMDSHPKAGAAGVQMLKANGEKANESRRGLPTPMTAFYKMTGLCARYPKHKRLGHYYMGYLPWDEPGQIEVISGAFLMVRKSVLDKVGLLDEDYFMYGEDIDLSYRILKGGYENWYVPARILHYKGESTQKSSFRYVHVFYEAMLIFIRKHYGHLGFLLGIPIRVAVYAKAAMALVSMQMHKIKRMMGFADDRGRERVAFTLAGTEQMRQECQRLMSRKGLATAVNAAAEGYDHSDHYRVYDIDHMAFADILDEMAAHERQFTLATYSMKSNALITDKEVYT